MLTQNRFFTNRVLIFSDLNKTQLYKMPYGDSPHHEIEIFMSFTYLKLLKLNQHTEGYLIRKPNDKKLLIEISDEKYIYVGEKQFTLKTNDKIVNFSSDLGFNDIK